MKTLLLSLFLIPALCFGQDTAVVYTQVLKADSMSKADIYEKVKEWTVTLFENTKSSIQVDDRETGIVAFDASTSALSPAAPPIDPNDKKNVYKLLPFYHQFTFKTKIQIKDGRYRVEITNIQFKSMAGEYSLTSSKKAPYKYAFSKQSKADEEWADAKLTFEKFAADFIASLHKSVTKKSDW